MAEINGEIHINGYSATLFGQEDRRVYGKVAMKVVIKPPVALSEGFFEELGYNGIRTALITGTTQQNVHSLEIYRSPEQTVDDVSLFARDALMDVLRSLHQLDTDTPAWIENQGSDE